MARVTPKAREHARERLLAAGAELIAREGLERAGVDAIAIAAGYAKGTFYNYFESKEQLFAAVISEGAKRAVRHHAAAGHAGTTRERLLSLAAADVAVVREQEAFTKVVVREALAFRPETYPLIVESLAPFIARIAEVLSVGVAAGEVRSDRPVGELALLFTGTLSLMYVQHWGSSGTWPELDEIPALVVGQFLDGAGAGERGR